MPEGGTCRQRTRERCSEAWRSTRSGEGRLTSAKCRLYGKDDCRRNGRKLMAALDDWWRLRWSEGDGEDFPEE